jgi:hypothetical protein
MYVSKDSMWRGIYCFFAKYFGTKQGLGQKKKAQTPLFQNSKILHFFFPSEHTLLAYAKI